MTAARPAISLPWATLLLIALFANAPAWGEDTSVLLQRPWFEARTPHFHTYSCGVTQEVARLAARLEQFRIAYEALAGTQAVASPPIQVIALPDRDSLTNFVPLYQGQPSHLAGFFHRGSDENLIVLSLAETGGGALETIFHEYAHLLLRRNQEFWPMWLNEGMADIYATFEVTDDHSVRIGSVQPIYIHILKEQTWLPLSALFAVAHDSPDYNERDRQGIFYAESWLLTHYLMVGSPAHRQHFGELTRLLKKGQTPEQAFTNAFRIPSAVMEKELAAYLKQSRFDSLSLSVSPNLMTAQPMSTRRVIPPEACFILGDELLRVGRIEEAEPLFLRAARIAPNNPFAYEGMGFLEAQRGHHREALENLKAALAHGSKSFLAYFLCARETLILSGPAPDTYTRLEGDAAVDVKENLEKSLSLMPEFGPAHHLLGFFELLQGTDLSDAARHLKKAIDLEPENPAYLLTLAQVQLATQDTGSARSTLQALCLPYVDARLRDHAEEMLKDLGSAAKQ
ncbi:MAG TPA: tetratricopeptide repeat protein [Verrucomicrobiae bacterium]|nr:tetratricopeptide repeat protein [Verrucomicrobiae bacterium]